MTHSALLTPKQCAIVTQSGAGSQGFIDLEHSDGTRTTHTLVQAQLLRDASIGRLPSTRMEGYMMQAAIADLDAQRKQQLAGRALGSGSARRARRARAVWPPFGASS